MRGGGPTCPREGGAAACYRFAGEQGHRLDLVGATADRRGELTCVACGATGSGLDTHLLAVAADALIEGGALPPAAGAELIQRAPSFDGTLTELIVALGGHA